MTSSISILLFAALLAVVAAQPLINIGFVPYAQGYGQRVDHIAFHAPTNRLFITYKGNNSLGVLDVTQKRQIALITAGLNLPNDVVVADVEPPRLYVSNSNGHVTAYHRDTYQPLPIDIALGDGADNMKHDEQNKLLYVAYGSGSIAVIRTDRGKREPDASQNLASHPEGFHYSRDRKLIYCNVPGKLAVVKIQNTVAGGDGRYTYLMLPDGFTINKPTLLIEPANIVVTVTRVPPKVVIINPVDGKVLNSYDTVMNVGDTFYDSELQRLYVLGAEGNVHVLQQNDASAHSWTPLGKVPSGSVGWTGFWDPEMRLLFVATQNTTNSGVLIYRPQK